ncbi:MAG TPA: hypothetical protein VMU63_03400 [Acidimicrobiales bacterium]|nr:hypothetical protein [Acidimicrobiales bacterium]
MEIAAGARLRSAVCDTEVVVTKGLADGPGLYCGGAPMLAAGEDAGAVGGAALDPDRAGGTVLGKRYTDASGALEVLCVKAGRGGLALGEELLSLRQAKPLPSSD